MSFLNPEHFQVLAGEAVVNLIRASRSPNRDLCKQQERDAKAGIVGVEIVKSNYGYSVRYDSGLQNWSLIASARQLGGTEEAAFHFAREWVARDPERRYAWTRKAKPAT